MLRCNRSSISHGTPQHEDPSTKGSSPREASLAEWPAAMESPAYPLFYGTYLYSVPANITNPSSFFSLLFPSQSLLVSNCVANYCLRPVIDSCIACSFEHHHLWNCI